MFVTPCRPPPAGTDQLGKCVALYMDRAVNADVIVVPNDRTALEHRDDPKALPIAANGVSIGSPVQEVAELFEILNAGIVIDAYEDALRSL